MNRKTYDSVIAAKYLLALAFQKGIVLNVTKVQKMLYIAYGYFLANHDYVITAEEPKAWPYGPVFPRTRNKVKFDMVYKTSDPELVEIVSDELVTQTFNNIIDKYAHYSAAQLSEWSHMDGGPWALTTKENGFNWNEPIPNNYIKTYFKNIDV